MSEMDVNAIAGTLKLYFRELPEPLFTDELYSNFAVGVGQSLPALAHPEIANELLLLRPAAFAASFVLNDRIEFPLTRGRYHVGVGL